MIGRQHGYYPTDNVDETFLIDWALETSLDFWVSKTYRQWMPNAEQSEANVATAAEGFAKFNKLIADKLTARGEGVTFLAGDRLTIADFTIFSHYMSMSHNDACELPIKPAAAAKVAETPVVEAYIARMKVAMADYMSTRVARPIWVEDF